MDSLRVVAGAHEPLERRRGANQVHGLRKLTRGRTAAEIPPLLAALFSLCGEQHRITAQRALDTAQRLVRDPDLVRQEGRFLRATCLREQLVRIGLDWPRLTSATHGEPQVGDLQGLPRVPALTQLNGTASEHTTALTHALYGLIGAAEQRVLGMTSDAWLRRYENCTSAGVQQWAHDTQNSQAPAAWLARVEAQASSLTLQLSGASLFDGCCDQSLTLLAAALGSDPTFVERAELSGCSLESGAFNRAAWPRAQRPHEHVFGLLAARIVDVVQLCRPEPWLRSGCLRLGPAEAIAYTELARGLLVHWVKLALPELRAGRAVVEDYRIITPTDFALHPQGALAKRLRTPDLTPSDVQLLVGAFDPCLELEFASAATLGASDA